MIVTPIKIQGKKTKLITDIRSLAEGILKQNPDIDTWVEPFLGSGVVAFNCASLSRIGKVIVNDINPHVIGFYSAISTGELTGEEVREAFRNHGKLLKENGADYYNEIKDRFNREKKPMDFLFLTRTGFNGVMRFNSRGEWNVPFCKLNDRLSDKVVNDLAETVVKLSDLFQSKEFEFHNESFETVIEAAPETSLFYCDPPYFGLDVKYYRGWEEQDEIRLNSLLDGKRFIYSTWMDNGRKVNPMIEKYWGKYQVKSKEHKYMLAEKASDRVGVTEGIFYTGEKQDVTLW